MVSIDQALLFTVQSSSGTVQGLITVKTLLSAHSLHWQYKGDDTNEVMQGGRCFSMAVSQLGEGLMIITAGQGTDQRLTEIDIIHFASRLVDSNQ